jgi:hypothetical protein
MDAQFGPFVKKDGNVWHRSRCNLSEEQQPVHTFWSHKERRILNELKVEADGDKLSRYKTYWLRHVTRRNSSRMARTVLNGKPNGRRWLGRPLKSLSGAAETYLSRPDCWQMMMMMMIIIIIIIIIIIVQRQACRGQPQFNAVSKEQHAISIWNSILKMAASGSYETKRCNIPEDGDPFTQCR